MKKTIAVLPGDGVGNEVMEGAVKVLESIGERFGHHFEFKYGRIGGEAIDIDRTPLPQTTVDLCKTSDAVLLGAVGGPKWDNNRPDMRPEKGLLAIRKELGLFANLRPVRAFSSLIDSSPLKRAVIQDVDLMIVRELTGGLYFGKPSERRGELSEEVVDTLYYKKNEMQRILHKAFQVAETRKKKVTSVDKANVLESSRMWRETANEVAEQYPDVELEHMLVDNAAMQLIRYPKSFDVIVTENMFGDILSDEASMISGSLGMLPSASLASDGSPALYEPVHGSAPDIAGENKVNPLAMVLSAAQMLRYSFNMEVEANVIEKAIEEVLDAGYRTVDISEGKSQVLSTKAMIRKVILTIEEDAPIAGIMSAYA